MEPPPRRFRAIALILSLTGLAVGLWFAWSRAEPVYRGKPISYWIEPWQHTNETPATVEAAFAEMDDRAVEWLARRAEPPSVVSDWWERVLKRFNTPLDAHLRRGLAVQTLGQLGERSLPAMPVLERLLTITNTVDDDYIASHARAAVVRIRHEPIETLIADLTNTGSFREWYRVAMTLAHLGKESAPAVPPLIHGLDATNGFSMQWHTVNILRVIAQRPDLCVPRLVELMRSPEPRLRAEAMEALRAFGPEAVAAGEAAEARAQRQR